MNDTATSPALPRMLPAVASAAGRRSDSISVKIPTALLTSAHRDPACCLAIVHLLSSPLYSRQVPTPEVGSLPGPQPLPSAPQGEHQDTAPPPPGILRPQPCPETPRHSPPAARPCCSPVFFFAVTPQRLLNTGLGEVTGLFPVTPGVLTQVLSNRRPTRCVCIPTGPLEGVLSWVRGTLIHP